MTSRCKGNGTVSRLEARDELDDNAMSSSNSRRKGSGAAFRLGADKDEILKAYQLSSLSPSHWEVHDTDDTGVSSRGSVGTSVSGKGDEPDALSLRKGGTLANLPHLPAELKPAIMLHSKTFDPKMYLATVHPLATFKDLSVGRERLKDSLEQRSEALKVLVEAEFDRFVAIKAATSSVFEEMKEGPLADNSDYGVKELKDTLKSASTKADRVYTPILDARQKADRLRSSLSIFERSKSFFNLPGVLLEAIEAGKYDTALLAYKKGKYIMDAPPSQLLARTPGAEISPAQEQQMRRIYNKVWKQVDRIIADLKVTLGKQLRDPRRSVEEVEKTIQILLELDPADDPVWIFLDTEHARIMDRLSTSYTTLRSQYQAVLKADSAPLEETPLALDIKACLSVVETPDAEIYLERANGAPGWKAIHALVKALCETLLSSLPKFWAVGKAYMAGKYKKASGNQSSRRNPTHCKGMTTEIITHFITLISEFFKLSSAQTSSPVLDTTAEAQIPHFVPIKSNSLTASMFLLRLLEQMNDCVNELSGLSLPAEIGSNLHEMLTCARWKFEETLCILWVRDAKLFYRLENWQLDPNEPFITLYVRKSGTFQRAIAKVAYRIAGGSEDRAAAAFAPPKSSIARNKIGQSDALQPQFLDRIRSAFLDALYAFLDGLVHVAFSPPMSLSDTEDSGNLAIGSRSSQSYEIDNVDNRIMLTVSNLSYLQTTAIARLVEQFQSAMRIDMASDIKTLKDVIQQLDKILFDDYLKRKAKELAAILQRGILGEGVDWHRAPKPTEVHGYVYECLLCLVLTHAQVSAVAKPLVDRTLAALIDEVSTEALACFQQVPTFGLGGMLQATLEIEFLHQTLSHHVAPEADAKLQDIYKTISQSYQRQPARGEDGSNELKRELDQLKKTLVASRRATALQFLCFRTPKTRPSAPPSAPAEG